MPSLGFSFVPAEIRNVELFFIFGVLSTVLVTMAKAGFGGSAGLLSVPLLIMACGGRVSLAMGIMLPLLIAGDYVAVLSWWRRWKWRVVLSLLPGVLIGLAMGWVLIWQLQQLDGGAQGVYKRRSDAGMMLCIGIIALGFVGLQVLRLLRARPPAFRPVPWQSLSVGTAAGFTSTMAHAAGPIVTMYMLRQQMPREQFVASTVLYYWIGNQIKLVPYYFLGLLDHSAMVGAVVLMPAVVAGTLGGIYLHRRVGQRQFTAVVYVLLALAGVHMILGAIETLRAAA